MFALLGITSALLIRCSMAVSVAEFAEEALFLKELPNIRLADLPKSDIELVIARHWYTAMEEMIKKSHVEGVDVSIPIRNGVQAIKVRLDTIVKLLDPEYGRAQVVNPAFQWAQSDSSIYLSVKFSRRFNAPGALDVSDLNCTFTNASLNLSALGGHSGKQFEYQLSLEFFDYIDMSGSNCTMGSVGKLAITMPKLRGGKWPRLLVDTRKIDNMHHWFDYAEKLDLTMTGLSVMKNSGRTCGLLETSPPLVPPEGETPPSESTSTTDPSEPSDSPSQTSPSSQTDPPPLLPHHHYYCVINDRCLPNDCSECKGKEELNGELHLCEGPPVHSPRDAKFTDTHMEKDTVGGELEITIANGPGMYDIEFLNVYKMVAGTTLAPTTVANASLATEVPWLVIPPNSFSPLNNKTKIEVPTISLYEEVVIEEEKKVSSDDSGDNTADESKADDNTVVENTNTGAKKSTTKKSVELVVVPANKFGEKRDRHIKVTLTDKYLPRLCGMITDLSFSDTDGDKGKVKGTFKLTPPSELDGATHWVLYWGKNSSTRLPSKRNSSIVEFGASSKEYNWSTSTAVPKDATHILFYPKGSGGEVTDLLVGSVEIKDNVRPTKTVPRSIRLEGEFVEIQRDDTDHEDEDRITGYTVQITEKKKSEREHEFLKRDDFSMFFNSVTGAVPVDLKLHVKICAYASNAAGKADKGACMTHNPNKGKAANSEL